MISNLERMTLSNMAYMMSRANLVTIGMEIVRKDIGRFLEKRVH